MNSNFAINRYKIRLYWTIFFAVTSISMITKIETKSLPLLMFNTWVELECNNSVGCLRDTPRKERERASERVISRPWQMLIGWHYKWQTCWLPWRRAPTDGDNIKIYAHSTARHSDLSVFFFLRSIDFPTLGCALLPLLLPLIRLAKLSELPFLCSFELQSPQSKLNTHEMTFTWSFEINAGNVDAKPKKEKMCGFSIGFCAFNRVFHITEFNNQIKRIPFLFSVKCY